MHHITCLSTTEPQETEGEATTMNYNEAYCVHDRQITNNDDNDDYI